MKRLWTAVVIGLLVVALGAACSKRDRKVEVEEYRIGVAAPFTGDYGEYGEMVYNGAALYVEQINAEGGIDGKVL